MWVMENKCGWVGRWMDGYFREQDRVYNLEI